MDDQLSASSSSVPEPTREEEDYFVSLVKKFGNNELLRSVFGKMKKLLDEFNLNLSNSGISFSLRKAPCGFSFNFARGYVIHIRKPNKLYHFGLAVEPAFTERIKKAQDSNDTSFPNIMYVSQISSFKSFAKADNFTPAYLTYDADHDIIDDQVLESLKHSMQKQWIYRSMGTYRQFHNAAFYKAVVDETYRNRILGFEPFASGNKHSETETLTNPNTKSLKDAGVVSKNVIFYGPPGTGKTYFLKNNLMPCFGEGRYSFVTFHQSFCYEDFVEGIKPKLNGAARKSLSYCIEDGIFKKACADARKDPDHNYALFIDEINRGNVANIFGELITLIEEDKRAKEANEINVILPYSKKKFSVPANLYIIGTMNTADRSVEALDTALRRRFSFVATPPKPDLLSSTEEGIDLKALLETINERIEQLIDGDHAIGHSYLLGVKNVENLRTAFKYRIIPLLSEYFYDAPYKMYRILGRAFMFNPQKVESGKDDINYDDDFEYGHKHIFKLKNDYDWSVKSFKSIYQKEGVKND